MLGKLLSILLILSGSEVQARNLCQPELEGTGFRRRLERVSDLRTFIQDQVLAKGRRTGTFWGLTMAFMAFPVGEEVVILVTDRELGGWHGDIRDYLKVHPEVSELIANPTRDSLQRTVVGTFSVWVESESPLEIRVRSFDGDKAIPLGLLAEDFRDQVVEGLRYAGVRDPVDVRILPDDSREEMLLIRRSRN